MKNIEKKEITETTAIRAIITGFVSYSIIIGFIAILLAIIVIYFTNKVSFSNELLARVVISLMGAILIYIFLHFICKISNVDLFRKCKFDRNKEIIVSKRLNLFYLLCILFFVLLTICSLYLRFQGQLSAINYSYMQRIEDLKGTEIAVEFANIHRENDLNDFYIERKNTLITAIMIELSLVYSFISLIPYQKKMLNLYNTDKI